MASFSAKIQVPNKSHPVTLSDVRQVVFNFRCKADVGNSGTNVYLIGDNNYTPSGSSPESGYPLSKTTGEVFSAESIDIGSVHFTVDTNNDYIDVYYTLAP